MQYTHAYRHTYMQTYKHLCLYMQYALACMHAGTQTFLPIHALYTCMHAHTLLYTFLGNTHMQYVNMCNIFFLDFDIFNCAI